MAEEEKEYIEHEIVDRLYCLEEKDFDKTKVDDSYIQAVIQAGKENKKLVDKLQKEDERYKKAIEKLQKENEEFKERAEHITDSYNELLQNNVALRNKIINLKEKIKEYEIGKGQE